MATGDVAKVLTNLFTAPTEAAVNAASEQRRVWIDWLRDVERLVSAASDEAVKRAIVRRHLDLAPVWKMAAQVSVSITMRVASIKRFEGGATLGLAVGLLQASGSFGFMSESSTESVMQARAQYALTNETEVSLADYLEDLGVDATDPAQLKAAISKLGAASTPLKSVADASTAPKSETDDG